MKYSLLFLILISSLEVISVEVNWPTSSSGVSSALINGNTFFYSPVDNWDPNNSSRYIHFNINVSTDGFYALRANVIAESGSANSFFVVVNDRFSHLWSIPVADGSHYRIIDDRIYLKAGDNHVYFYARESDTKLADLSANLIETINPVFSHNYTSYRPSNLFEHPDNLKGLWVNDDGRLKATYKPRTDYEEKETRSATPTLKYSTIVPANNEYTLSYKVRFNNGFDFVKGGKLHGMGPTNSTAGCAPETDDGWSNRLMWKAGGKVQLYIYHQNRTTTCGTAYDSGNTFEFKIGEWYTVSIYTKVNSGMTKSDGVAKLYIDGVQLIEVTGIKFRNTNDYSSKITKASFNTFFGGSGQDYAPDVNVSAYFDDFKMVKGDYPNK